MFRKPLFWAVLLVIAAWAVTSVVFPRLPEKIPVHWNIHGQVDRFDRKSWASFLLPMIMVGILALTWVLPRISPRQYKVESFQTAFEIGMLLVVGLMVYIQAVTLWAAFGARIDVGGAILGGVCAFFAIFGPFLSRIRRNFWMGIRTPWTLASERVWDDTHRLGAKLFLIAGLTGVAVALCRLPPAVTFLTILGLILLAAFVPVFYSLAHYKQLERRGEL